MSLAYAATAAAVMHPLDDYDAEHLYTAVPLSHARAPDMLPDDRLLLLPLPCHVSLGPGDTEPDCLSFSSRRSVHTTIILYLMHLGDF